MTPGLLEVRLRLQNSLGGKAAEEVGDFLQAVYNDLVALQAAQAAIVAKLNADEGVTDTDYAAASLTVKP